MACWLRDQSRELVQYCSTALHGLHDQSLSFHAVTTTLHIHTSQHQCIYSSNFTKKQQKFSLRRQKMVQNKNYFVLVILSAQWFWENPDFTLFRLNLSKKLPHNPLPPGFCQQVLVSFGLLEYYFRFGKNCSQPKKWQTKTPGGKNAQIFFITWKSVVIKLFLLVSSANFLKVYEKKEKKTLNNCFLHIH